MKSPVTILALLLALATTAQADDITHLKQLPVTGAEHAWTYQVATDLDLPTPNGTFRSETWVWTYGGEGIVGQTNTIEHPTSLRVRGLTVELKGVTIRRLRLRSPAAALTYAAGVDAEQPKNTVVIEARKNQVLILTGPLIQDAEQAAKVRRAAWKGLGAPTSRDFLGVTLGQDAVAARSVRRGPFELAVTRALEKARKKREDFARPDAPIRARWNGEDAVQVTGSSFTAHLIQNARTSFVAVGTGEDHALRSYRADELLQGLEYYDLQDREKVEQRVAPRGGLNGLADKLGEATARIERRQVGVATRDGKRTEVFATVEDGRWVWQTESGEAYDPAKHGRLRSR